MFQALPDNAISRPAITNQRNAIEHVFHRFVLMKMTKMTKNIRLKSFLARYHFETIFLGENKSLS